MKKYFLILLIISPVFLFAQSAKQLAKKQKSKERKEQLDKLRQKEEEGALIFNKQDAFGIKLNSDGWGAFYEHGKFVNLKETKLWWVELGERKSNKQQKFKSQFTYNGVEGNPFIYGKVNNFYYLKGGIGGQRLLGGKALSNGVAVSALYGVGASIAVLKPYYLQVIDTVTSDLKDIKYDDNPELFLDGNYTYGASGFGTGFNKLQFVPGLVSHFALRFDYGALNNTLLALEVGINLEYYSQPIAIMAFNNDKNFYFNSYVALVFGGRK